MSAIERKEYQNRMINSKENIVFGSLMETGLTLEMLKDIERKPEWIVRKYTSGLTAEVFHLKVGQKDYSLKKKRDKILVLNDDGQLSFLNEVLNRVHFESEKNRDTPYRDIINGRVIKTLYANFQEGILLSEWIDGDLITDFNEEIVGKIYELMLAIEQSGKFEWDMCKGNILIKNKEPQVFDFGYMYDMRFDEDINSEGMSAPVFHMVERLETRSLMPYLLELEESRGKKSALLQFRSYKLQALKIYNRKIELLKEHIFRNELMSIHDTINKESSKNLKTESLITFYQRFVDLWSEALMDEKKLIDLYECESFRSYTLDIHDDLSGKTCTIHTIKKIDQVIAIITKQYEWLKEGGHILWFDEPYNKEQLIDTYKERRRSAKDYFID